MTDSFETISFAKQSKIKVGKTTYIINSYFDDKSKTLKEKIKNLLISKIQRKIELNGSIKPKNLV